MPALPNLSLLEIFKSSCDHHSQLKKNKKHNMLPYLEDDSEVTFSLRKERGEVDEDEFPYHQRTTPHKSMEDCYEGLDFKRVAEKVFTALDRRLKQEPKTPKRKKGLSKPEPPEDTEETEKTQ